MSFVVEEESLRGWTVCGRGQSAGVDRVVEVGEVHSVERVNRVADRGVHDLHWTPPQVNQTNPNSTNSCVAISDSPVQLIPIRQVKSAREGWLSDSHDQSVEIAACARKHRLLRSPNWRCEESSRCRPARRWRGDRRFEGRSARSHLPPHRVRRRCRG